MPALIEEQTASVLGCGPVADLALLVETPGWNRASTEQVSKFLQLVRMLARQEQALELRRARVLAWMRTQDVCVLGFSSWTAFSKEHSGWSPSWTRALIRLVESPLELVKDAVSRDILPLSIGVLAPGNIGISEQAEWILRAARGALAPTSRTREDTHVAWGEDAWTIARSRDVARLLVGCEIPKWRLDAYVRKCWENGVSGRELIEHAKVAPQPPDRIGTTVPPWGPSPDPATEIVGAWTEPADLTSAARTLEELRLLEHGRTLVLGLAYTLVERHGLWRDSGALSLETFIQDELGKSLRTFQRYARMGWDLFLRPDVKKAVEEGLAFDRAEILVKLSTERTFDAWRGLARRLGQMELERAVVAEHATLDQYAAVVQEAVRREATETGGRYLVALREGLDTRRPRPAYLMVHPEQLKAAKWFLDNVVIPREHGVRRIIERDRHTCQNPFCRSRCLRVHVHHLDERQHGGSDDPANLITLCIPCHLRLLHGGRLKIRREGDFLIWSSQTLPSVLMHSPLEN